MYCFFTLKIENTKGEVFELTHNTKNYVVADVQGLTRPSTTINTSACAGIDGSFFNSARMNQRNIVIDLVLRGDIEANRQRLYSIFPAKTPCTVYFKNHNRNVKIKGYVETLEGDIFQMQEQMQISIICPKPFWEDMEAIYSELADFVKRFKFPFSIEEPIPISAYGDWGGVTIENPGDVELGFTCTITIQSKAKAELFKEEYTDPMPEDVLKRYAYIPLTLDEYNPETDTISFVSTVQPSENNSDRYITVNGTRYLERIYDTDQTGAVKTLTMIRAEGCTAKDLKYYEFTYNSSLWSEGTEFTASNKAHIPYDSSKSYLEVRGMIGDTPSDVLSHDAYTLTVGENVVVKLKQNLSDRGYTGLRIIFATSESGIDVSGATGARRLVKEYKWPTELTWYPCRFKNYDKERDILRVYDGGKQRYDWSIQTLTYEDGESQDFIFFYSAVKNNITYEVIQSVDGADIRHYSTWQVDAGLLLVDRLTIYNRTTGKQFGLDYQFRTGDVITICTLSGEFSVTLNRGGTVTNLLSFMMGDSTWLKLAVGKNQLSFSAATNPDAVYAVFKTALLYGGI